MTKVLLGKKLGMVTAFVGEVAVPVTRVSLLPMTVSQIKTQEKDGYQAVQVVVPGGKKKTSKATLGHLKKATATGGITREIPFEEGLAVGAALDPVTFIKEGMTVTIQATSKGKGLAGVVKLHHFAGGPKTHGQSDRLRRPGSIGQGTTPGRVYKGKKMAGRMGVDTVTIKNARVVGLDGTTLLVKGSVPGPRGAFVRLEVKE